MPQHYGDAPGGDDGTLPEFTTSGLLTSPSTWLTLATYSVPFLNLAFRRDVSDFAIAVGNLAPVVSTGILVWARSRAKSVVTNANLEVIKARFGSARDGDHEARIDELELVVHDQQQQLDALLAASGAEVEETITDDATAEPPPRRRVVVSTSRRTGARRI